MYAYTENKTHNVVYAYNKISEIIEKNEKKVNIYIIYITNIKTIITSVDFLNKRIHFDDF